MALWRTPQVRGKQPEGTILRAGAPAICRSNPGLPGCKQYLTTPGEEESEELTTAYEQSQKEAKGENLARYEDILAQRKGLTEKTMADIEGYGKAGEEDISRRFTKEGARIGADLASRGLSGTTIGPAMRIGLAREQSSSLGALRERVGMMKAGTRRGLEEEEMRFKERREDTYPQMGMLAQLQQRLGAGTYWR